MAIRPLLTEEVSCETGFRTLCHNQHHLLVVGCGVRLWRGWWSSPPPNKTKQFFTKTRCPFYHGGTTHRLASSAVLVPPSCWCASRDVDDSCLQDGGADAKKGGDELSGFGTTVRTEHSNYNCNFKPPRHLAAGLVGSLGYKAACGAWPHTQTITCEFASSFQQPDSDWCKKSWHVLLNVLELEIWIRIFRAGECDSLCH